MNSIKKQDDHESQMSSSVRVLVGAEILVIDKDPSVQAGITAMATALKMHATCFADPADAWAVLQKRFFSVVILDLDTPRPNAGLETIASIRMISPVTSILVLTPRKSYDAVVDTVRAGALDLIHKSPDSVAYLKNRILVAVALSLKKQTMHTTLEETRGTHQSFLNLLMKTEQEVVDLKDEISDRQQNPDKQELRILVVDPEEGFYKNLKEHITSGYAIVHAQTGGEALDRGTSTVFHLALLQQNLPDLPQSMVIRGLKTQTSELVALTYSGPGIGGTMEIAGMDTVVIEEFQNAEQFVAVLPELTRAFWAKEKQRRYTQAFRERHYDFVQKFVALKSKLESLVA